MKSHLVINVSSLTQKVYIVYVVCVYALSIKQFTFLGIKST